MDHVAHDKGSRSAGMLFGFMYAFALFVAWDHPYGFGRASFSQTEARGDGMFP